MLDDVGSLVAFISVSSIPARAESCKDPSCFMKLLALEEVADVGSCEQESRYF
jgi:hypothetical protein